MLSCCWIRPSAPIPATKPRCGFASRRTPSCNQFAEARADIDELIKLRPADAELLACAGLTMAALKADRQGMADIERALAIDPNKRRRYFSRG